MYSPSQVRFRDAEPTSSRSSSSPAYSSRSLSSASSRAHTQPQTPPQAVPEFKLHRLLRTSQEIIADNINSYLLWDVREHPFTAQSVEQLGTRLSFETLNAYATEPPIPLLRILCSFPDDWELLVSASAFPAPGGVAGSTGARNSFPVYPPLGQPAFAPGHIRSSSASPRRIAHNVIPHTPAVSTIPLPMSATTTPAMNSTTAIPTQPQTTQKLGVTISDIVIAIYNYLHAKRVHRSEFESWSEKQQYRVQAAFEKRTSMAESLSPTSATSPNFPLGVPSNPASAASASTDTATAGILKVDTLLSCTWFAGMNIVMDKEWTVSLSLKRPAKN